MPIGSNENQEWGFLQWALTFLATTVASCGAFVWRLMLRIEKLETAQVRHRDDLDAMRGANDAAMLRFAERFAQLHDDHFRLREAMGAVPTRVDLRELEDRLADRLAGLSDRLDRVIDG